VVPVLRGNKRPVKIRLLLPEVGIVTAYVVLFRTVAVAVLNIGELLYHRVTPGKSITPDVV
jgi:hypothetical protein